MALDQQFTHMEKSEIKFDLTAYLNFILDGWNKNEMYELKKQNKKLLVNWYWNNSLPYGKECN